MSMMKTLIVAAALSGAFATTSQAQYYGHPGYGYYQPQPQYVHPRIARKQAELDARRARKQAELDRRFANRFGYGYQQPHYGYQPQPRYYDRSPGYGYRPQHPGYGYYGRQRPGHFINPGAYSPVIPESR
jgi:hypothetical protein